MLPDPPHKLGFYSTVPRNKAFIKWSGMSKYHEKVNNLNEYLEKNEKRKR